MTASRGWLARWLIPGAVGLLVAVGVAAAGARAIFVPDLLTRTDSFRMGLFRLLDREDPFAAKRPAEVARFDGRFADHPGTTWLHVVPGGIFLLFAPFQFSAAIRRRSSTLHRWSGRVLLMAGCVTTAAGLFFAIVDPYAGGSETIVIGVVGVLFFFAAGRAFGAIRRREVTLHREWMIRVFAIALGISTVRVIGAIVDLTLTPAGIPPEDLFLFSVIGGWVLTIGTAEGWIRYTRPVTAPSSRRVALRPAAD